MLGISVGKLKSRRKKLGMKTTGLLTSRDAEKIITYVRCEQGKEVLEPKKDDPR